MIVKVQVSLATSHEKKRALIYNEDRSTLWEGDIDISLEVLLGRRPKAFLYAEVNAERILVLGGEAPWQEW